MSSRSGFRSRFKLFSTLPDHRLLCSVHLCIANKRAWCLLGVCEDALADEVSMIREAEMVWLVAVSFFVLALAPPWGAELPRRTPRHKANRRAFTAFFGQRRKRISAVAAVGRRLLPPSCIRGCWGWGPTHHVAMRRDGAMQQIVAWRGMRT